MVGVPTSRGCDACRRRKKKCDAVTNGCSWCRKNNIPCVGYGRQRYNFRDEGPKLKQRYPSDDSTSTLESAPQPSTSFRLALTRKPSSELDILTQVFVHKSSPSIDISHQLVWNFGAFLSEIPKRLGVNEALDAAADVLMAAHTNYCAGYLSPNARTLTKHSRALNALGKCLNDPVQARSSEALCSVMLLSICQVFMRDSTPAVSHFVGASQILKSRGLSGPKDDFERLLLCTLRGPVAIEALFDPRIHFTPTEWRSLVVNDLDTGTTDGDLMLCLVQLPNIIHTARYLLDHPNPPPLEILDLQSSLLAVQTSQQTVLQRLLDRWSATRLHRYPDAAIKLGKDFTLEVKRMIHCHHARMLAFGLAIGILINEITVRIPPADPFLEERNPASIAAGAQTENDAMAAQILELAEILLDYRPLGSMSMTLFLGAAWAGTSDPVIKTKVERVSSVFGQDLYGGNNAGLFEPGGELWECFRRFEWPNWSKEGSGGYWDVETAEKARWWRVRPWGSRAADVRGVTGCEGSLGPNLGHVNSSIS